MEHIALFAAVAIALYAGHHVGDYWVQTDHQARHKGDAGPTGEMTCLIHCATLGATQVACLALLLPLGATFGWWQFVAGMLISIGTHYLADRREHGIMFRLARLLPGKAAFLRLGVPRTGHYDDNPSLGTGAWALDQAWHIFWGVFIAALVIAC